MKGYGTIRPPDEEEEWGDKVFKSTTKHGCDYAKYLKKTLSQMKDLTSLLNITIMKMSGKLKKLR